MLPYTGDYIEHIKVGKSIFKFYSFTPRSLIGVDMYQMDDEVVALRIEARHNLGFPEKLVKYTHIYHESDNFGTDSWA